MNVKRALREYKFILLESMSDKHIKVLKKLSKPMYDYDISTPMGVKTTVVRKLLNELHGYSLVEYERIKDKKTGWYTYIWRRRDDKIVEYTKNSLGRNLRLLEDRLQEEQNNMMFSCKCKNGGENKHTTLGQAMEYEFVCPVCDTPLKEFDNSAFISKLESDVSEVRKGLKKINAK